MGDFTNVPDADFKNPGSWLKKNAMYGISIGAAGAFALLGWNFIARPLANRGGSFLGNVTGAATESQTRDPWGNI
jgi:hypothetical protein